MATVDVHSSCHLDRSHFGLAYVLLVETIPFPKFFVIFPDLALRKSLGTFSRFDGPIHPMADLEMFFPMNFFL